MTAEHRLLKEYNFPKDEINGLIRQYRSGEIKAEDNIIKGKLEYPPQQSFMTLPPEGSSEYSRLYETGLDAINGGRLGMVILNGGMATRFGGVVKGIIEVFDGMSFLELKIKDTLKVSGNIRFFIMNSFATQEKTKQYFKEKNHFNIPEKIKMFNQFIAPRITESGEFFKPEDEEQAFYGPGHGDFPYALRSSGLLDEFISGGGEYIFYSNVDNLGARVDPAILGFHMNGESELSAEVARKSPGDIGGAPVVVNGKLRLVDGFCFPGDFDQSGIPVFNCATYWVNAVSLKKDFKLPWYVVKKKVEGQAVVQFEHLAGDMTVFLDTIFIDTTEEKRFFPIKKPADLEKNKEDLKKILGY